MFVVSDDMKNRKAYDGKTFKFGISYNGQDYIVKFAKDDLSVYTEYIASSFIRALGYSSHVVYMGIYRGQIVSIIKDFTSNTGYTLHSYEDTNQSSEDTDIKDKDYTYADVLDMIRKHTKMSPRDKSAALSSFWDMFILDAILGNRDRHKGNWGYVSKGSSYKFAPLYDNGGSLYPGVLRFINQYIDINTRKKFLWDRVYTVPASVFKIHAKNGRVQKSNYAEIFSDLRVNRVFAERVKLFRSRVQEERVFSVMMRIVRSSDLNISVALKRFYVEIVTLRYMVIVERKDFDKAYTKLERELSKYFG